MSSDSFAIPPRRVRRMSFILAALIHAVGLTLSLNYLLGQFQQITDVKPIARSELVDEDIVRELTARIDRVSPEPQSAGASATTAVEPGSSVIESVAARIRNYKNAESGPDPLETVRRNAALLEQISGPKEVDRMADRLRKAMDAKSVTIRKPDADTPGVDWDRAVQSDGKRVEEGDRVEIRESFVDDRGGASTMIHVRAPGGDSGKFIYTIAMIERGKRSTPTRCTKSDFDAAAARIRAFEVIDEYPLLKELHRAAIVPIMQKLNRDDDKPSPTTQPATSPDDDEASNGTTS